MPTEAQNRVLTTMHDAARLGIKRRGRGVVTSHSSERAGPVSRLSGEDEAKDGAGEPHKGTKTTTKYSIVSHLFPIPIRTHTHVRVSDD